MDDRLREAGEHARGGRELERERPDPVDQPRERRRRTRGGSRRPRGGRTGTRCRRRRCGRLRSRASAASWTPRPSPRTRRSSRPAASTRWHGTTIAYGLRPSAWPTARAAPGDADRLRHLAVRHRLARRDGAHHLVHLPRERRQPIEVERDLDQVVGLRPATTRRCGRSRDCTGGGGVPACGAVEALAQACRGVGDPRLGQLDADDRARRPRRSPHRPIGVSNRVNVLMRRRTRCPRRRAASSTVCRTRRTRRPWSHPDASSARDLRLPGRRRGDRSARGS